MINEIIESAIQKREALIQEPYESAFRLLNGFSEGLPDIMLEVFGKTLVYQDYSEEESELFEESEQAETLETTKAAKASEKMIKDIVAVVREKLPWIESGILKKRRSKKSEERNGKLLFGKTLDNKIKENKRWYAVDLTMNRDTSFYLDTRNLRRWITRNVTGKSVLNTFAYTGSLGIAALTAEASEVIHLDLNRNFLNIAKRSAKLNKKEVNKSHYQIGDFWSRINQFKKNGKLFDCVILDPPVYTKTKKGIIDLAKNYNKVINKVRPLINDGGHLITISNALFQKGEDHKSELEELCEDGYLSIETIIPVPEDCVGDISNKDEALPADPAPYNHSTKITILNVKRKTPNATI
jgi:23S rRNA (cytosine1962-C5)-methyltransferase